MNRKKSLFAAVSMLFCLAAHGQTLDFACMQSFDVKDKTIEIDRQTLSCRFVEEWRAQAFERVSSIEDSNDYKVATLVADLEASRQQFLHAASGSELSAVSHMVVGNAIGSMGLAGCVQTALVGCAIGAAGFIWAKYETIRSAVSADEKKRAATEIATKINELKKVAGEGEDLGKAKKQLIADFNKMCALVQEQCLD